MGIPSHLLPSMKQTFQFEGGYVAHDLHGYPALFGFTAQFLKEDAKRNGIMITEAQAAADITAMYQAHLQGKDNLVTAHSRISYAELSGHRYEKDYDTYFKRHGFEAIASNDIQKYGIEFSYNRGPDSFRWGMMYAAGVMPRDADPLLNHTTPAGLSEAINYANGFLATGENRHADALHPTGDQHTNMIRFNARLRVAKMMQESQYAATHANLDSVLGRFNRAFEFDWPKGTSMDHPGFDPIKDVHFLKAYDQFKTIYKDYQAHQITHEQFNHQIAAFSSNLLHDPALSNHDNVTRYATTTHATARPTQVASAPAVHAHPEIHPHSSAPPETIYYSRASLEKPAMPPTLTVQYYSNLLNGTHIAFEAPGRGIIADISVSSHNEAVANNLNVAGVTFTPAHQVDLNANLPNSFQLYDGTMAPATISWKDANGRTQSTNLTPDVIASITQYAKQGASGFDARIPNMRLEIIPGEHLNPATSDTMIIRGKEIEMVNGTLDSPTTPVRVAANRVDKART
jgi:hypothetical protein